jgi:HK97 family phage portal protein
MGIFARAATRGWRLEVSNPRTPAYWVEKLFGGGDLTASGIRVTPENALGVAAIFAAVRNISEDIATLPMYTYEQLKPRGKRQADELPIYNLLLETPNPEMDSVSWKEALQGHLLLRGNCYAEIDWDQGMRPRALWPLRPDKMRVMRNGVDVAITDGQAKPGELVYRYTLPGGQIKDFAAYRIFHVRGFGSDGILGYSPIHLAREAVGLAMATEEFGGRFFGNDARPGVVLTHPGHLSKTAKADLREDWEDRHKGLTNAQRVAVLEEGLSVTEVGVPPEDAQFLQTRTFQLNEVARMFRMPPHMLAELTKETGSTSATESLDYTKFTMRPWCVRWEKQADKDLLPGTGRYFTRHQMAALLRGDDKTRWETHQVAWQMGAKNANDALEDEDENPLPGDQGTRYFVPLNYVPVDSVDVGSGTPPQPKEPGDQVNPNGGRSQRSARNAVARGRLRDAYRPLFADAYGRSLRREEADVMRQARKSFGSRGAGDFGDWLDAFYAADSHGDYVARALRPALDSYGDAIGADAADEINAQAPDVTDGVRSMLTGYLTDASAGWCRRSRGALAGVMADAATTAADPVEALQAQFDDWASWRPASQAADESTRAAGAITRQAWRGSGIRNVSWVARDSCPYCTALHGQVRAIDEPFLAKGQPFEADGADEPLVPESNVHHAPIHDRCICDLAPAR